MYHRWESLLFLHWRVAAARVQETLPAGITVDTFEGDAYLAIVPFFMRRVRPIGVPALPWISDFLELNVRTYAYDEEGVPGVWFYSLDCNQPLAVAAARVLTGLRYMHAEMSAERGEFIEYSSRRRSSETRARYRYRGVGAAQDCAPESFEFFALERYYLFAQRGSSLVRGQVAHAPVSIPRSAGRGVLSDSGAPRRVYGDHRTAGAHVLRRRFRRERLRDREDPLKDGNVSGSRTSQEQPRRPRSPTRA
jgi:uncharacterized protein YqjF (DUF2071 family)